MQRRDIFAKDVPELAASAESWMRNPTRDGAGWMMGYFYGTRIAEDGEKVPDDLGIRIAAAQAIRCAASLDVADLFSVNKHKTDDVLEAALELPADMEVKREYFDTDNGFMAFEHGYFAVMSEMDVNDNFKNGNVRILALSWRIFGNKLHMYGWTGTDEYLNIVRDSSKHRTEISNTDLHRRIDAIGPLIICGEHVCDLRNYMQKAKAVQHKYGRDAMSILLAACLMLKQDVTARSRIEVKQSLYRFGQRPDMNTHRAVTIIDKRSIKANPTNEDMPEAQGRRQLTVRYDVRGHWRQYKDERFSPEVREYPIWIPAHWVGDESLPVLDRKKVTRLKR
jgi:hypothetical protein